MKVLVGSKNQVKIKSVKEAFEKYYENVEVEGFSIPSNVPEQPVGNETFTGAENRALALMEINLAGNLNADFFVGIEGGIIEIHNTWFGFGCMCVIDKNKNQSFGASPFFELPGFIVEELLDGIELGEVMDKLTGVENSKHKDGAIGFFTNGIMNRKNLYVQGLITALAPFQHKNLFFEEGN